MYYVYIHLYSREVHTRNKQPEVNMLANVVIEAMD